MKQEFINPFKLDDEIALITGEEKIIPNIINTAKIIIVFFGIGLVSCDN